MLARMLKFTNVSVRKPAFRCYSSNHRFAQTWHKLGAKLRLTDMYVVDIIIIISFLLPSYFTPERVSCGNYRLSCFRNTETKTAN